MAQNQPTTPENRPARKVKPDADDFPRSPIPGVLPKADAQAAQASTTSGPPAASTGSPATDVNRPATPAL